MTANNQDAAARGLRPLLSAPSENLRTPVHLSNLRPKNKSVRAACETCRKKKSKCTGERPQCQPCVVRGTDCHYETIAAETHSQARKRKYDDLQNQTSIFQELYQLLRIVPEEQSRDIFDKMRSGADPESLVRFLKNGDLPLQPQAVPDPGLCYEFPYIPTMPTYLVSPDNVYLKSPLYDSSLVCTSPRRTPAADEKQSPPPENHLYLKPYHSAKIADERLENVSAAKWTTVISDNTLMSNLLNSYFLHAYPAFPAFQKDLFLDDMVTGQTQFCSKLLVNAVLAQACHCHKPLLNRSKHWTSQGLAYRFMMEAKRLWDIEDVAEPKLTTVQAAIILNVLYNSNGTDRIGSTLLQRAVAMADELRIFTSPSQPTSEKMVCARQFTAWCLFIWQVMHGYYFFKAPLIDRPPAFPLPDPDTNGEWYGELWLKYPESNGLARFYFPHAFKAWAELRTLVNDLSVELFEDQRGQAEPQGKLSWSQVFMFRSCLEEWYRKLPWPLQPEVIALPCQIRIHMEYYSTLYAIYQTKKDSEPPQTPLTSAASALSVQSLCSPTPEAEPPVVATARLPAPQSLLGGAPSPTANLNGLSTAVGEGQTNCFTRRTPLPGRPPTAPDYAVLTERNTAPRLPSVASPHSTPALPVAQLTYSHANSQAYNYPNSAPSPTYSLPHRYPSAPASTGVGSISIAAYSASSSTVTSPGAFSTISTPVYSATAHPNPAPGPLPTPRPSISLSRLPLGGLAESRPSSVTPLGVSEATAQFLKCFETLARLYYLRHSFEYYDSFLIYFLTMLGTAAIERASETRDLALVESLRSTIALCMKGIYNQGENFYLASVVARVLKNRVRIEDLQIILQHGDLPEVDEDEEDIQADNIRAEWPIPIINISQDRRTSMIDTLVHTVSGFKINGDAE